jgi:hypothetical protein
VQLAKQPLESFGSIIERTKGEIDRVVPGGVRAVERIKGESMESILGVESVRTRFEELISATESEARTKKIGVVTTMDSLKEDSVVQLKKQRPVVPIYDQLPGFVQDKVY